MNSHCSGAAKNTVDSPVNDISIDLKMVSPELRLGEDGIFYSGLLGKICYPDEGNEACFEVEDQSFWFRHRSDYIRELVRKFPPKLLSALR